MLHQIYFLFLNKLFLQNYTILIISWDENSLINSWL